MTPLAEEIVATLTAIAGAWQALAAAWHLAALVLLVQVVVRSPSPRFVAASLAAPVLSVGLLAWWAGNPFNAVVFLALAIVLAGFARAMPAGRLALAKPPALLMGAAFAGFGWTYPHFVTGAAWRHYLFEAPLGLIPCPTLAMVAGVSIMVGSFHSRRWAGALSTAALFYGVFGAVVLGVWIDVALVAAGLALGVAAWSGARAAFAAAPTTRPAWSRGGRRAP